MADDGASMLPRLRDILSALMLESTTAQQEALLTYVDLLRRWNSTYNLTAVREPTQMLGQHLADCLAVVGPLRRECGLGALRLLDVGSGPGLPGVVIALLNPLVEVTCVDSVGKKAAFVRQVAGELHLANLRSRHTRVEGMEPGSYDVISSRAFASLQDFTGLTRNQLAANGTWLAMKGKVPIDEIEALDLKSMTFHVEQLKVPRLEAERCIVWMRRAKSTQDESAIHRSL